MPLSIAAMPDASDPTGTSAGHGWPHDAWAQINGWASTVPTYLWVIAVAALAVATVVCVPALRTLSFKAGARHGKTQLSDEDRRDRRLLIAAMIPASLFWIAVLIGSGRGLIAFGRDNLHWHDGWEYLVPFTLDGVAIAFALLAFRAVRKEMNPDRAVRIAAAAMIASAGINFLHEVGGSKLGAGYLAILSLLGMLIFDELLAQFEEGAEHIKRSNPKFGLRWLTWPTNTVCAWVAWRNYPPAEGTRATVANAVANLDDVRQLKVERRAAVIARPVWWMRFAPWAHVGALRSALVEQRSITDAERQQTVLLRAEIADLAEVYRKELAETVRVLRAEVEQERAETERVRSESAERVARLQAEHAAHVSRIRERNTSAPASAPARTSTKTAPAAPVAEQRLTNDEAVALMLQEHPEPGYDWGQREVARLTGAGFSRIPKLIAAVREHHARSGGAADQNTTDDDAKEHSA
jgi:hypothetical protein